jgi:polyferredoxin
MLDENSLTVTYNDWRGEPRSRHAKKAAAEGFSVGDCVDCNACVAVCPMGIDIRDGQQLECITCALCIDACDGVMDKIGKERGLISYATLADYQSNMTIAIDPATRAIDPLVCAMPTASSTRAFRISTSAGSSGRAPSSMPARGASSALAC